MNTYNNSIQLLVNTFREEIEQIDHQLDLAFKRIFMVFFPVTKHSH
jgi:hypothetical protein